MNMDITVLERSRRKLEEMMLMRINIISSSLRRERSSTVMSMFMI